MKDNNTIEYYDDFAGWYERERKHGYHAMLDELEIALLSPLAEDRDVLEVGAGTGLIMEGLGGLPKSIIGLDISSGMLKRAQARDLKVVQGSATQLPFDDEQFDLAYSFKVLAHVPDIERALQEMARVLRPGGYLVAEFYNARSIRRIAKWLGGPGDISERRTEADVFTRWDTPEEALRYLPGSVVFEKWQGIRVLTPFAKAFGIPGVATLLPHLERRAMDSILARFGGFLVAVSKKV